MGEARQEKNRHVLFMCRNIVALCQNTICFFFIYIAFNNNLYKTNTKKLV